MSEIINGVSVDVRPEYDTIWVGAGAMTPTTTNGAAQGANEYATNDITKDYLAFDTTTEEYADFNIPMPEDWDLGTVKAKFYWAPGTASGATGDTVEFQLQGQAVANDGTIDVAFTDTGEVVSDAVTAGENADMLVTSVTGAITITGAALASMVQFKVSRNVGGTDDHAYDAWLFGVWIQYKLKNVVAAW